MASPVDHLVLDILIPEQVLQVLGVVAEVGLHDSHQIAGFVEFYQIARVVELLDGLLTH